MKQETLPQIIIKYSNNYDDLNFLYEDYCFFQNLIYDKKKNETLIFYAIKTSNKTLFDFLLEKNCDIHHKNKFGYTPIKCANNNKDRYFYNKLITNNQSTS